MTSGPNPIPGTQYLIWLYRKPWLSAGFSWAEDPTDEFLQASDVAFRNGDLHLPMANDILTCLSTV